MIRSLLLLVPLVLLAFILIWIGSARNPGGPNKASPPKQPPPARDPTPLSGHPAEPPRDPPPPYTTGSATRDGTGKFYMGREIALVMGHQAIGWLERGNRESEEAPSRAIAALDLAPDDVIADIGAGSGYYTFRLAPLVPEGKVVAVDIQPEMLAFLEKRKNKQGVTNIDTHLGAIDDSKLPPSSIDAALFVDAYHEFSHPYEMMQSIVRALRPGGRVFLLEFRAEDPTVRIKPLHKMTQAQAKREMAAVGLQWEHTADFLPQQHFMVFRKP